MFINIIALVAQFYVALYPVGGPYLDPKSFFQAYLAGPFLIALYLIWKVYSWFYRPSDRPFFVALKDIDIYSGMRPSQLSISGADVPEEHRRQSVAQMHDAEKSRGLKGKVMDIVHNVF